MPLLSVSSRPLCPASHTQVAPGRQRTVAVAARKAAGKTAAKTTRAAPKQAAKGAAYICLDCGWVYSGQDGPFEKLPRNYKCAIRDV
jgi:hypothetical protein